MKYFPILFVIVFVAFLSSSCAVDTYYDSVSTSLTFELGQDLEKEKELVTYRRFVFDRDFSSLKSIVAQNAWASSEEASKHEVGMSIFDTFSVYLIDPVSNERVLFLESPPSRLMGESAEFDVKYKEDLKKFQWNQRIEIEVEANINAYKHHLYKKENCQDTTSACDMNVSLSIWFMMK